MDFMARSGLLEVFSRSKPKGASGPHHLRDGVLGLKCPTTGLTSWLKSARVLEGGVLDWCPPCVLTLCLAVATGARIWNGVLRERCSFKLICKLIRLL